MLINVMLIKTKTCIGLMKGLAILTKLKLTEILQLFLQLSQPPAFWDSNHDPIQTVVVNSVARKRRITLAKICKYEIGHKCKLFFAKTDMPVLTRLRRSL